MSDAARDGELFRLEKCTAAMGAACSIILYGRDAAKMEAAIQTAFDEARRIEMILSVYRPESEWSEINRSAAQRAVAVSPGAFELLSSCLDFSRRTEGAFDITVGPLLKAWGIVQGDGRLPGRAELDAALSNVGYRHIRLDAVSRTVRFDRPDMEIDPGGIGKGFAVDRMVGILRREGFDTALVTASASSIYGMGAPPAEPKGWQIEIPAPGNPRTAATIAFLKDASISTSGCYEKSYWAGGRLFSHMIDPRTGYPAKGMRLASVTAPRAIDGEAWTKAFFINGRCWAAKHKPGNLGVFLCEDRLGGEFGWLGGTS